MPESPEMDVQTPSPNIKPAQESLPDKTSVHTADPGGKIFFDISWQALEEANKQVSGTEAPQIDLPSRSPSRIKIPHALSL